MTLSREKIQENGNAKWLPTFKGNRDVGVATLVVNGQRLFVKTVEWEDL